MDAKSLSLYCLASKEFYEPPARIDDRGSLIEISCPSDWITERVGLYTAKLPLSKTIDRQGWKIHISGTLNNYLNVLESVAPFLYTSCIHFKYARSKLALKIMNSKYWPRELSGKAITIYPSSGDDLEALIFRLSNILHGFEGPRILSDLQIGDSPIHLRYGAFTRTHSELANRETSSIRDSAGVTVPDVRRPYFLLPDFIEVPPFIKMYYDRSRSKDPDPWFAINKAIHFSNGGGVYLGNMLSKPNETLIFKEARPHAAIDNIGDDAVKRLQREVQTLRLLDGKYYAPKLIDEFEYGSHKFICREFVAGKTLFKEILQRYPIVKPNFTTQECSDYVD